MKNKILTGFINQKMGFRILAGFIVLAILVGFLFSAMSFYHFSQMSAYIKTIDSYQISVDKNANWQAVETAQTNVIAQLKASQRWLMVILLISLVLAILIAHQITHSITKPLVQITEQAKQIANGDLLRGTKQSERDLLLKRKDEIGDIAAAFEKMITYLQNIGFTAKEITKGNLVVAFQSVSAQDELGNTFEVNDTAAAVIYARCCKKHYRDKSVF